MVFHGNFPDGFDDFRTTPPDPNLKPTTASASTSPATTAFSRQEAYDFYKKWNRPGFPRYLVLQIQHANPFYDDPTPSTPPTSALKAPAIEPS